MVDKIPKLGRHKYVVQPSHPFPSPPLFHNFTNLAPVIVLLLNALCILDVDRFLGRIDLAVPREYPQTKRDKIINIGINMANTFRKPTRAMLIPLNVIFIVLKLLW